MKYLFIFILISCSSTFEYNKKKDFDLQGHRGARGLAPENTLPAFQMAMDLKVNTLELDTVLTKDKILVVHHDTSLNPELCQLKTGEEITKKKISELTYSEIKKLDCGSKLNKKFPKQKLIPLTEIPSLSEFFSYVKNYEKINKLENLFQFNIETKIDENFTQEELKDYANAITKEIEEAKVVDRSIVQSFVLEVLPLVKNRNSKLKTSALFFPSTLNYFLLKLKFNSPKKEILSRAKSIKADIISPYHEYVDEDFILLAKENNRKVIPWTINDKKRMLELYRLGVDGIISDYPDLLLEALKDYLKE
jgi:glycerophosphoryl diester phosphodiesterase